MTIGRQTIVVAMGAACSLLLLQTTGFAQTKGGPDEANGYAGTAACLECHKDQALTGPHGAKSNHKSPAFDRGCETCHGPGLKHAQEAEESGGDLTVISLLDLSSKSSLSAEEKNATCLNCHDNGHTALWQGSTHERRGVSCSDCHNPHSNTPKNLAAASQTELCSSCHKDVRSALMRNSHHPVREGKMECSDCHNPHGTVADKLIDANIVNEKCFECHADKRGPFLWEHAPVTENCLSCHSPHGSSHDKLLNRKTPFLCQTCHSNSRHPGTIYALAGNAPNRNPLQAMNARVYYRNCMNCHSLVHGSNHPSGKSLSR